eukprot:CAMPEP_0196580090 /NCGR_PEP_ID=MMETSP1081-20130531/26929_1 /TAXON_ID=36882 /ORGANISM="Pyramimonas amylifera, Strain CCMP720" /LENGTH=159 /DNA_ID=CAMNT_0041899875 /DNA_START=192 /DNA_END=671 /DNA_ORIENTATION=+
MSFQDLMELMRINNEENDGVFDFSTRAAQMQEKQRVGVYLNDEFVTEKSEKKSTAMSTRGQVITGDAPEKPAWLEDADSGLLEEYGIVRNKQRDLNDEENTSLKQVDNKQQTSKKKKYRDLWGGWQEGGIRNKAGKVVTHAKEIAHQAPGIKRSVPRKD